MRAVVAAAVVVVLGAPRVASAYRPFDQTDADTAELDTVELELGPIKLTTGGGQVIYGPGGVFNYGFSDGWELVFDYDAAIPLGDLGSSLVLTDLQVKHVLRDGSLQGRSGPSVALELGPLFPTIPTFPDEVGFDATLIVSQRWSDVTVHLNSEVAWERDRAVSATNGFIIEGPQRWRLRPVAETYVSVERGASLYSGLVGAIYRWRSTVVFDAALRIIENDQPGPPSTGPGTSNNGASGELRVGLTWVIPTS
ncbi:MAG TPA: hypothetical protein VGG74_10460 [Kofleriaceae bacterium]